MKRITANQYQTSERYYKLPKILFEDEKYMDMKLEVKVAYSILKDRLELSLSRGWIDEEGAVYLVFSNSKLMRLLGCSKSKLLSIKKILKEYDLIDEVQQSSSEKGRLANKIYLGELSSTPVGNSNRPSVKKRLGQVENETAPVSHSAPSETEVSETKYSETDSLFIEDEEERNTQPILRRKVEKVTKYDRDYIWGLVQDQFRREGFSETASEIAMTDFEKSISMLLTMFALLDVRKCLLNLCLTACILFGTTVLEKEVVKMSPIEWVLVMLIFISSGVTVLTMVVDKKGVIKK